MRSVCFLLFLGMASCAPKTEPPWRQEAGYRWRELDIPSGRAGGGFTRMDAGRTRIRFENSVSDSLLLGNRYLGQGAGVCLGDVDGDGRVDVFIARTEGPNKLYRNLGDWRFEDITDHAGVAAPDRFSTGCALADIRGTGALDLILLATTGPNAVFLNDGHGRFTEHRDLGLDATGSGGTTVTMADVDGDGWLDLYVANYKAYSVDDSIPPDERRPAQIVRHSGAGPTDFEIIPERRDDYKIVNRPDMGGLRLTQRGSPDQFYLNRGGRFERVEFTSDHFRDANARALGAAPESFALDAKLVDLNQDGAPDLYVANDFEDADELWMNDGHGNFRLASWKSMRQMSNAAMGVDAGDINGDGLPDLFVVDMLANDRRHLKTQTPTHTPFPKKPGDVEVQLQQQRNTLFLNRGDGTFAEISSYAGVQASGWSWSTMFLDVDLDGWQDVLVANGHLWDIMDADTQERLQNAPADTEGNWRQLRWKFPPLRLSNVAWRNRGDLTFEDASARWNFDAGADISHSMAAADLDGDGDLDVIVNRLGAPALVLRNDAASARVAVRIIGDAPNTRAVGAKVRLLGGATPLQEREIVVGGLYLSHSDYMATFAMGNADTAMLVIDWRDGRHTSMSVRRNRLYEITTATAQPARKDSSAPASRPLFEDVSGMLGGHTHVEPAFDDWGRQFLLPNALSQLGPGVSWFDYDRDGYDDLIVGTGRGGRLGVFHNDHGRLVPERNQSTIADADYTGILGYASNARARILAGVSSWEGQRVPSVVAVPVSGRTIATRLDSAIAPMEASTGPLALGDYSGDGYLDLFVGGRAIPGAYPRRTSSELFRSESGRFVMDSANNALLHDVGLVSAAIFADVNGDGHPDLILAREWDSILLLFNDGHGHFTRASDSWGLSRWTSRWNGIATGDVDGDGRLDIVATSWGRNTMTPADSARPLVMFYGPFGSAHEEEVLISRQDTREKRLFPLNSYGRLRVVLRDLPTRVNSFASYADADVEEVLGPHMRDVQRAEAVTLDHMIFFNRGDHFEAKPLPPEAQFAPAFGVVVADFDGDGIEDVFIAQNFSATAVGLPRYDSGRGLLLRGDGKGGLTSVRGEDSGIIVYGDQRGAAVADFDRDGRPDLVLAQNAGATKLFHNRGGKAGLRVRLIGPPSNPDAIGSQLRVIYDDKASPVREIQAGSGYWSQNGTAQVFGVASTPREVWVRWPGGSESRVPVPAGAREVTVRSPGYESTPR